MSSSYLVTATPGTTRPDFTRLKQTLEDIVLPQYTRYATDDDVDPAGAVEVVSDPTHVHRVGANGVVGLRQSLQHDHPRHLPTDA